MSLSYFYLLMLIGTGLLLMPVSATITFLLEGSYLSAVPDRKKCLQSGTLWLFCAIVALQGYGWVRRIGETGLDVAAGWGWGRFIIASAFALILLAVLLMLLYRHPGWPRRVVLITVLGLSVIQIPYWFVFGIWALIDILASLPIWR